jgi:hypothetical protein
MKWNSRSSLLALNLSTVLESRTKITKKPWSKKKPNGRRNTPINLSSRKISCKMSLPSLSRTQGATKKDSMTSERSWDTFHCATQSWSTLIARSSSGSPLTNSHS